MTRRAMLALAALLLAAAAPPGPLSRYEAALRAQRVTLPKGVQLLDPAALAADCANGSVQKLDWTALGGRQRLMAAAATDCGAGAYLTSLMLVRRGTAGAAPPALKDLFDVARMPGQRALPRSPIGVLEIALMADGVAPADVYPTLRGKDGVSRAFARLSQLRPYIVWWTTPADVLKILARGGALLALAPGEDIARTRAKVTAQVAGAVVSVTSFALSPSATPAKALPAIDAATRPALQTRIAALTGLSPTAAPSSPPSGQALAADSLYPGAHLDGALVLDGAFWQQNGPALQKRFADWLAH